MSYVAYNTAYKNNDPFQGPAWNRRFDDFDDQYALTSNLPVVGASPYSAQASSSGTFSQASPAAGNGIAVLSGAATTTKSGVQIQRDHPAVLLGLGVTLNLTARVELSDATNSDLILGVGTYYGATGPILNAAESAILMSNLATSNYTDFVGIYKPYGQTVFYPVQMKASGTPTGGAAMGAATTNWTIIGFNIAMDPVTANKGVITFYQDDAALVSYTSNAISSAAMAEFLGFLSATASGTISCSVDWIDCFQSR